jgi:hypothetical protein
MKRFLALWLLLVASAHAQTAKPGFIVNRATDVKLATL